MAAGIFVGTEPQLSGWSQSRLLIAAEWRAEVEKTELKGRVGKYRVNSGFLRDEAYDHLAVKFSRE
jgi:hypothetical protein